MNSDKQTVGVAAVGQNLMAHAKTFNPNAKRGLVIELFPAICGASEFLSARNISKFLKEKHGVKLSAVTVTKALNDSGKSWNQFFDIIEPYVEIYEKAEKRKREEFLYDDERFKVWLPNLPARETLRKHLWEFQVRQAIDVLRERWFSIDLGIRIKAMPYLAERLKSRGAK